jgi:hypothetical protein
VESNVLSTCACGALSIESWVEAGKKVDAAVKAVMSYIEAGTAPPAVLRAE